MELRGELRYGLNAPANFSWEVPDHGRIRGEGVTRDLSIVGAFVVCPTCPPVHTTIRVEIALPSLPGMRATIHLAGKARVVRVEHPFDGRGANGFAMVKDDLDQWTLLSCHSEPSRRSRGSGPGRKSGNEYLVMET